MGGLLAFLWDFQKPQALKELKHIFQRAQYILQKLSIRQLQPGIVAAEIFADESRKKIPVLSL